MPSAAYIVRGVSMASLLGHAGEFNNSLQGPKLNRGEYTVIIVPINGGDGREEHVKIEAEKVTTSPRRNRIKIAAN